MMTDDVREREGMERRNGMRGRRKRGKEKKMCRCVPASVSSCNCPFFLLKAERKTSL
jgi:hypothetical protein